MCFSSSASCGCIMRPVRCCSMTTGRAAGTIRGPCQRSSRRRPVSVSAVSAAIGMLIFMRCDGQVRPVPAARVVAGRDGRPDAGQRAHPRRHHGGGGRVPRGARVSVDGGRRGGPDCRNMLRPQVVAWIGAITALLAASIAVAQNDIKRILAYSTVSQLGYMMLGLGTAAWRGHVPSHHARVLQGAVVPGRGLGHSRLPRGTGHPQDGRPAAITCR
jgi:hypothetical protein